MKQQSESWISRHRRWVPRLTVTALQALSAAVILLPHSAQAQTPGEAKIKKAEVVDGVQSFEGALDDGTPFLVRKPANWNGIVIIDMDGEARRDQPAYQLILKAGYGTAGSNRRKWDRFWTLNRLADVGRPLESLAVFKAKFGKPRSVIVFGRSAGGAASLLTAEHHPEAVDGAVSMCATMPFGYAHYNVIFDFFYSLKALLAPNDDRLLTHALPPRDYQRVMDHWLEVLQAAAKTPEGRARIALAYTIAQYPVYGSAGILAGVRKPNFDDPKSVSDAMVANLPDLVGRLVHLTVYGEKDLPPDLQIKATAQPDVVGNDGAVYADYWKNGDPSYKRATQAIYAQAGLNFADDLKALDAAPRVNLDRTLLGAQGLIGRGLPTMPVFRMDNLGDLSATPNTSMLYDALVAANGFGDLYRTSYVDNSGHCFFKPEQELAAIEVMRERLETRKWPATDAASLNARAGVDDGDGVVFVERKFGPYTGMWRLMEYPDVYRPATFATATALVNGYDSSKLPRSQQQLLLVHLAAAKRTAERSDSAQTGRVLDQFADVVKSIRDRVVRTRLSAVAHQLRVASH